MEDMKKRIKEELKQELLEEIQRGLKLEEEASEEMKAQTPQEKSTPEHEHEHGQKQKIEAVKRQETINVSATTILKVASHALKYANQKIPQDDWVEVIGLLSGTFDKENKTLNIEDAYPMGHGDAIYAEIKDYKNFVRAFNDLKAKGQFICGWYHSHPGYGLFISEEDFGTQARYQRLWKRSVALVIDPFLITKKSFGFDIFRAELTKRKWFKVKYNMPGISPDIFPNLLDFIKPIVDGKALYLEYDE